MELRGREERREAFDQGERGRDFALLVPRAWVSQKALTVEEIHEEEFHAGRRFLLPLRFCVTSSFARSMSQILLADFEEISSRRASKPSAVSPL